MTLAKMQPLDVFSFPLSGVSLIEASAGTGKTYTIVNLYLRLLLGHGCQPLNVDQILVVTFTNAATGELKERIRLRLRQAYLDFYAEQSQDPFTQQLIEQSENIELDCHRLALASKQMDEAAVYTIHGFCHKALTEHAFESGAMYEQHFILDESEWLKLAAEDYWRKHISTLSSQVLQFLLTLWPTPSLLLKSIQSLLSQGASSCQSRDIDAAVKRVNEYTEQVAKVKQWWLSNDVSAQLAKAKLNGRSKLAKLSLLDNMQQFCQGSLIQIDFDKVGWRLFFPEQVAKAGKKGSEDLSHLDFKQFEQLQEMYERCQDDIKLAFSQHALSVVAANLSSHKERLHLLSPDDLLSGLQRALNPNSVAQGVNPDNNALANSIRQNYPAALIDEFQDTDPVQFDVFKGIYGEQNTQQISSCWIMIGDPKQAIYAFRGADIFTYIKAKQWVETSRHFTLTTNWRSAQPLVNCINLLFESSRKGFLCERDIPFYPVTAGRDVTGLSVNGQSVESLNIKHLRSEQGLPISANEASKHLATATANQIASWLRLSSSGQARIADKPITAGDCCVLVRNRNEAEMIKQALAAVKVASVFLARKSVFSTQLAVDLYRLLQAISQPKDERKLKAALMSELFSLNAQQLDELFSDESRWQIVLEQCNEWQYVWQTQGLSRAINLVLRTFEVEQKLIAHQTDGQRRVTDLRHLIELLQEQSLRLVGETQLVHWFESCLLDPDHNSDSQQMRLESDANLVQIITLHSSKGLEFPLVFIPFASSYKDAKQALYHNDEQQLEVDFLGKETNLQKADFERLAEDIRLFYVAVTRAVYYCSIGLWNVNLGKSKKVSGFAFTALGSLLLSVKGEDDFEPTKSITDQDIALRIQALAAKCELSYQTLTGSQIAELSKVDFNADTDAAQLKQQDIKLTASALTRSVNRNWRLTSYSAISSQQTHLDMPAPGQDEGADAQEAVVAEQGAELLTLEQRKTPFNFERGANAGSFLHGVLENIDLQKPEQLAEVIVQQSAWFGIDEGWHSCLCTWLEDVLASPFEDVEQSQVDKSDAESMPLSLSALAANQVKVEMEFHMPLHQVKVKDFNSIINRYFKQQIRHYQFEQLNGMIKGFIDLMFEYEGKYYVADYKSNHLGDDYSDYDISAMETVMAEHDYHLQAILYTLALHRWLKNTLPDYQYDTHIGGAYYLFLRGMTKKQGGKGVYFMLPKQAMIEELDQLFAGNSPLPLAESNQQQLNLW